MLADRVVASKDFPVVGVVADRFERAIRQRSDAQSSPTYAPKGQTR
jgi:hypothetical protein